MAAMIKNILIVSLFFLFASGCCNDKLVRYEYKDKDGNVHVEYVNPDSVKRYKEATGQL